VRGVQLGITKSFLSRKLSLIFFSSSSLYPSLSQFSFSSFGSHIFRMHVRPSLEKNKNKIGGFRHSKMMMVHD